MLTNETVSEFTCQVASAAPAPGGGSASALMGALGASLTAMVAALTLGNNTYAASHAQVQPVIAQADALRTTLLALMDNDTAAFNQVAAAYALPKDDEQNRLHRQEAIQTALRACTQTPYEMMSACLEVLRLAHTVLQGFNASAASDLGVAALALGAAMRGAWINILINVGGITDVAFTSRYRKQGEALLAEALPLAESVYETLVESLAQQ